MRDRESAHLGSRVAMRLQLCGEPVFLRDGAVPVPIEGKDALLLAYLALEGATPRARLAALAWPEVDRERARSSLRQRLFRLRRLLGCELLREGEITSLRDDVQNDLQAPDADAEVQIAPLLGSFEWRGIGEAREWLHAARARQRDAQLDHLARQCSALEARGHLVASLQLAQRLVAAHPVSEHAHRRVMRLHYLRGDRAAALAAYERCVQLLDEELGTPPSGETRALARQIDSQPDSPSSGASLIPVTVLRPPRLVGRQREWQLLHDAWTQRACAVVIGEAGMGKTRLLGDFAAGQPGVLIVTARPGDARAPYSLLSRLLQGLLPAGRAGLSTGDAHELARILPVLGRPPQVDADAEAAQMRFLNAAQALLRQAAAAAGRVASAVHETAVTGIVVDDLHFADVASVEALQSLLAGDVALRWALACRPAELPPEAQAMLDESLRGGAAIAVRLGALDVAQVAELIDSLAIDGLDAEELAPRLARHTGGNPMFLLETIKALRPGQANVPALEPLPAVESVTELIQRRLARLSPEAVRLARCAAITGQEFSSELASQVLGVRPLDMADAWNELEAAQVFRGGSFAHDLIFEAALSSVPAPIATLLHGQIARYLEGSGHAPARVAQHWLDAGEAAKGAEALLMAAADAGSLLRLRERAVLLERAASVLEGLGERRRCFDTLLELQQLVSAIGTAAQGDKVYARLVALADDAQGRHRATSERITALFNTGRMNDALAMARTGVDDAETSGTTPLMKAELRARLASVLSTLGRMEDAEQQYLVAKPLMGDHPDPVQRVGFAGEYGAFLDNLGRNREARIAHQTALDGARGLNDPALMADILGNLGVSFVDSGLNRRAAESLQEALRLRESSDILTASGTALLTLGQVQRSIGEYTESLRTTEAQRTLWREERDAVVCLCDHSLATSYMHLGQLARARQEINASVVGDQLPPGIRAKFLVVRARLAALLGQPAQPLLAQADRLLDGDSSRGGYWRQLQLEWSRVLEPVGAMSCAHAVLAATLDTEHFGAQLSAQIRCATAALQLHDVEASVSHAQHALDLMVSYDPDDLYRAEVGWVAFQSLEAAGEHGPARAALEQTVAWVREVTRLHVPEPFKASFLDRNPVNRALLTAAARLD